MTENLVPKQTVKLESLLPRVSLAPCVQAAVSLELAFVPGLLAGQPPVLFTVVMFLFCVQFLRAGELVEFLLLHNGEDRRIK